MNEEIDLSNDFNVCKCQDRTCQYWNNILDRCGENYCKKYLEEDNDVII